MKLKNLFRSMKPGLKNFLLILAGSGTVITLSWLADGLKGECLFEHWYGPCDPHQMGMWPRIGLALGVFIIFAVITRLMAKNWLPVQQFASKKVSAHKVLIMPLSKFNPQLQQDEQGRWQVNGVDLVGDLERDIRALEENEATKKWNGLPFLRGLRPHMNTLEKLYLIGSSGKDGSSQQLEALRELVGKYTDANIKTIANINFQSVLELQGELESLIKGLLSQEDKKYREKDIVIDVTGGPKTTSIAGAFASLEWRGVEFQYVDTANNHDVLSFNVVVSLPERTN